MTTPSSKLTRVSRHTTVKKCFIVTSPSATARVMTVAACEPELPPVSMSSGMKNDSAITCCSTFS